jgi:Zn finger protein HypA/HybF involved in hydrogenase expression
MSEQQGFWECNHCGAQEEQVQREEIQGEIIEICPHCHSSSVEFVKTEEDKILT